MAFISPYLSNTPQSSILSKFLIYVQDTLQHLPENGPLIASNQLILYSLMAKYLAFKNILCIHSTIKSRSDPAYPQSFYAK